MTPQQSFKRLSVAVNPINYLDIYSLRNQAVHGICYSEEVGFATEFHKYPSSIRNNLMRTIKNLDN